MGKKITKANRGKVVAIVLVCIAVAAIFVIALQPAAYVGVPDTLPLEISVSNAITGAAVNTGSNVFVYRDGRLVETLDTGADGIVQGTVTYSTHEVLEIYITATNMIPVTITYTVPPNSHNLDYWRVPSFSVYTACNGESVYLTDYTLVEKDAASGSAWNCTPTDPFLLGFWYIKLDTDEEALGGNWWLPLDSEQYPIQRTWAIIKLTDANGYADGMTIRGWTLADDGVTFYKEITQLIVYDVTHGSYGVLFLEAYMSFPQSLNLHEVCVTAQVISQADPAEMAAGNYAASGLLWDDTDGAAVYIGMEA